MVERCLVRQRGGLERDPRATARAWFWRLHVQLRKADRRDVVVVRYKAGHGVGILWLVAAPVLLDRLRNEAGLVLRPRVRAATTCEIARQFFVLDLHVVDLVVFRRLQVIRGCNNTGGNVVPLFCDYALLRTRPTIIGSSFNR